MFDLALVRQRQKEPKCAERQRLESPVQFSIEQRLELLSIDFQSRITLTVQDDIRDCPSESADLVISFLMLHWCDDVPAFLKEAHRVLQPGGHFIAAFIGGESLYELRDVLTQAELSLTQGVAPRVSPMIDIKDAGMLLQNAGFQEVVVDRERSDYAFPSTRLLFSEIKNMGENNALTQRHRQPPHRDLFTTCERVYQEKYDTSQGVPVTMDIIYLLGHK